MADHRSLPADSIKSSAVGMKSTRHTKINIQLAQTPQVEEDKLMDYLATPAKRTFNDQVPSAD